MVSLLGTLCFGVMVGAAIGLVQWHRRSEATPRHPFRTVLLWIRVALGLLLAESGVKGGEVNTVKGGGTLGHGVSMVSQNVRLSGQRKCHACCSR